MMHRVPSTLRPWVRAGRHFLRQPWKLCSLAHIVLPPSASFTTSLERSAKTTVKVPPMAESINEGTISQLLKSVGDAVEADEEVATIETDKIDVSVNSSEAGTIVQLLVQEGDVVTVGQSLLEVDTQVASKSNSNPSENQPKTGSAKPETPKERNTKEQRATTASLLDAAPEPVKGSTPKPAHEPPILSSPAAIQQEQSATAVLPSVSSPQKSLGREERVEKLSRTRKTIASRLKQSQNICASLTTVQRVDVSAFKAWRSKYKEEILDKHGVRLGYMGAFVKAAALAAKQVPQVNASIDMEKESVTYRDYVDISVAVSTPKGLVTPVLHNCEQLNIIEIEKGVAALAKKARDGKLTLSDLEGGNFSISNPGIFGSMFGTPLINYPQAAVFNINSIIDDVVAVDGKPTIRPMMYITLTYDHRLIDGREAVAFLNLVKDRIEDPAKMLFN